MNLREKQRLMKKRFPIRSVQQKDVYFKQSPIVEEILPNLVMQAGKQAPRLYVFRPTIKGKNWKPRLLAFEKMNGIDGDILFSERPKEYIDAFKKNKKQIISDIAEGLAEQISLGVVHNDLEAYNLFFSFDKNRKLRARIFDYGFGDVNKQESLANDYASIRKDLFNKLYETGVLSKRQIDNLEKQLEKNFKEKISKLHGEPAFKIKPHWKDNEEPEVTWENPKNKKN